MTVGGGSGGGCGSTSGTNNCDWLSSLMFSGELLDDCIDVMPDWRLPRFDDDRGVSHSLPLLLRRPRPRPRPRRLAKSPGVFLERRFFL